MKDTVQTAFIFPGQGSQHPGMGASFTEWPAVEDCLARCDAALPVDLLDLLFDGSSDRLQETKHTQPAVLSIGAAVFAGVQERFDVTPDYVAGHSLGHFTAQIAAGGLELEAGVGLVRRRGELMARAGREAEPNTMVAVLLASPDLVASATEQYDDVSVAVYNHPKQTVISGTEVAIEQAKADIEAAADSVRFSELAVSAAFHSPVMERVDDEIQAVMAAAAFTDPHIPIVSDVTGEPYETASIGQRDLSNQVTSPVDWVAVVETLSEAGIERYVEFPPAGTLADLVAGIDPDASVHTLETPADAEALFGQ